jgi:hypothetical protein
LARDCLKRQWGTFHTSRFSGRALLLAAIILFCLPLLAGTGRKADAVIEQVYTLPFVDTYTVICGFGCYSGHDGTDYEVGSSAPGEAVVAATPLTTRPSSSLSSRASRALAAISSA